MEGHVHVPQETTQTSEGYYPAPKQFSNNPPPPYLASGPPPVQQRNTNVVVVNRQPQPRIVITTVETGDHFFNLSVILTVLCFFCGTWFALPCSIAAMVFASQAKEDEKRRDYANMKTNSYAALGCNIGAIVTWIIVIVVVVVILIMYTRQSACTKTYDSYTGTYHCQ